MRIVRAGGCLVVCITRSTDCSSRCPVFDSIFHLIKSKNVVVFFCCLFFCFFLLFFLCFFLDDIVFLVSKIDFSYDLIH